MRFLNFDLICCTYTLQKCDYNSVLIQYFVKNLLNCYLFSPCLAPDFVTLCTKWVLQLIVAHSQCVLVSECMCMHIRYKLTQLLDLENSSNFRELSLFTETCLVCLRFVYIFRQADIIYDQENIIDIRFGLNFSRVVS